METPSRTLSERLEVDTTSAHERLERLPFFDALRAERLPTPSIVSFLQAFAIIHAALEQGCADSVSPALETLFACYLPKVPLLERDLERLQAAQRPSLPAALRLALDYAGELVTDSDDALCLIGPLYVLERSQRGGLVLKRCYARSLSIPERQLSSIGCYGVETQRHWESFTAQLNAITFAPGQIEVIVRSAIHCFEQIASICAVAYPYAEADLRHHVAAVNFEAGDHAIPQSPREIELALRAGKATWKRYPYLGLRFGDRGKRFIGSDSCWLVTLARAPTETATRSLEWLRTVLASRGIPTLILEHHVRTVARALATKFPNERELSTRFNDFLARLESERGTMRGLDALPGLITESDTRLRACGEPGVDSAAQIIASAWLDERCGIASAFESVAHFFADPARFSDEWIAHIQEFVRRLESGRPSPC